MVSTGLGLGWDLAINFDLESFSATYNIHKGKRIVHVEDSSCSFVVFVVLLVCVNY